MRFHGASRTSELVPDFFVRQPTERPTRALALSPGQGMKQSPKSATFCFWRIVDHMSPVHAGQMLQLVDDKEFRHNKVSATIPANFQSRQFTIAHFTVHRPIAMVRWASSLMARFDHSSGTSSCRSGGQGQFHCTCQQMAMLWLSSLAQLHGAVLRFVRDHARCGYFDHGHVG